MDLEGKLESRDESKCLGIEIALDVSLEVKFERDYIVISCVMVYKVCARV